MRVDTSFLILDRWIINQHGQGGSKNKYQGWRNPPLINKPMVIKVNKTFIRTGLAAEDLVVPGQVSGLMGS